MGAAAAREDTARVQQGGNLIDVNGDRHGAVLEGGLQRGDALANVHVASDSSP